MATIKFEQVTLKSGAKRWEGYTEGPAHPVTGKRQQIRRRGKTQKEARVKILNRYNELEKSTINIKDVKKITFEQVAERWLKSYKISGIKNNTLNTHKKRLKVLNKHLGNIPIVNIDFLYYQDFISSLIDDYAHNTIRDYHTTANMIFKHAKTARIIKELPSTGITLPKKVLTVEEIENEPIEEKLLVRKELDEFLDVVVKRGKELDLEVFYLLAFSGLRSGELCALKWSDINFEKNTIRITKNLYSATGGMRRYELTTPKNKGSIRTIQIEQAIIDLLKTLHKRQKDHIKKYPNEIEHNGNFIFARPNGHPYNQFKVLQRMESLLKHTNITKNATPHIFRHTHISMLAEAGVDIKVIMDRVGHDDIETTLQIYTHVTEKMRDDSNEKMNKEFKYLFDKIPFRDKK